MDYKPKYEEIIIKSDDILRIKVSSNSSELSSMYSFQKNESGSNSLETYQIEGYLVDSEGFVNIPSLKKLKSKACH